MHTNLHLSLLAAEIVAQFKHTVLLMPNGVNLVTGIPFNVDSYVSEHSIAQPELKVSIHIKLFKFDSNNLCECSSLL